MTDSKKETKKTFVPSPEEFFLSTPIYEVFSFGNDDAGKIASISDDALVLFESANP